MPIPNKPTSPPNLPHSRIIFVVLLMFFTGILGRIISSEYMQKIYLVVDSIFKRRTDGSFVRLISPVHNGNLEATTQKMKAFAHELAP